MTNLRNELKKLRENYGKEYFIFIAPYSWSSWDNYNIGDYIINKTSTDNVVFNEKLDIYLTKFSDISKAKNGITGLSIQRWSNLRGKNIFVID
jgi:hypothetical protein